MNQVIRDAVMATLVQELKKSLGSKLIKVLLFGSRARGEAQQDSDYDVLILIKGNLKEIKKQVQEAEWHCMEQYNALVSCLVYTEDQWELRKNTPLGWNILRDGKEVA